jgi:rhodanese-related sulfurtransferase
MQPATRGTIEEDGRPQGRREQRNGSGTMAETTRKFDTDATAPQGYAGDIDARQAWELLSTDKTAVLIDVRSRAEWTFVGVPDLGAIGKAPLFVSWQNYATAADGRALMVPNPDFASSVAGAVDKAAPAIFICRSGGRSRSAAMAVTALGFKRAYNLSGGFEGDRDGANHRGTTGGWKAAGLAWTQE